MVVAGDSRYAVDVPNIGFALVKTAALEDIVDESGVEADIVEVDSRLEKVQHIHSG